MEAFGEDHWFRFPARPYIHRIHTPCPRPNASYGEFRDLIKSAARILGLVAVLLAAPAIAAPLRIVVLGDSLAAGYGVGPAEGFTVRLEAALRARGHDVTVVNAGVSGDTASDGLARLDWSVGEDADAVIVELGSNDALRGIDAKITRDALDRILARLGERRLPVLLAGMLAPRNLGADYAAAFEPIFPDLAARHGAILYRFFLDGVAADPALNQADGMHPNPAGVDAIVAGILPSVEALLKETAKAPG
jgi:acyl-CoA thioesterase-1